MNINNKKLPIQRVEIKSLHQNRNVILDFDDGIKILVDENGSGKTTFLNLLVAALSGDVKKLGQYDFQSIEIVFSEQEKEKFTQDEIRTEELKKSADFPDLFKYYFKTSEYDKLPFQINRELREKFDRVNKLFPYPILYFPTYRLVEENLKNLGYPQNGLNGHSDSLIQFGMEDVHQRWKLITEEIRNSSVDISSKINGHMLGELTEGINPNMIQYDKFERESLDLVLSRSGDSVKEESRQFILDLVDSNKIRDEQFRTLAYFLSNLITIHEPQKKRDDAIHKFASVVNGYLRDKEVVYDARALSLDLFAHDGTPIRLERLSAGEKQIISIFSKLLLDFDQSQPFATFFDEPELSLSMEWQEKLLQDMLDSQQIAFLFVATHSPFIYEGDLLNYTDVLDVTRLNGVSNDSQ